MLRCGRYCAMVLGGSCMRSWPRTAPKRQLAAPEGSDRARSGHERASVPLDGDGRADRSAAGLGVWVVGLGGLEPPTSSLSGMRSNRLSYRPRLAGAPDRVPDLADAAGKDYRIGEGNVQSVSLSVTSIPPPRWVTRL